MTTTKDLVDAIQAGKSATIQATFSALMTEKIQDGIEAYRQAVIDTTFNPELVAESEEISESFYVYNHDGKTNAVKKKFATNAAAKKHAEKLGGDHKVASSEYWHDKLNPSKNESELDEVAYETKALEDKKKPVIARGVKGMKSTPFEKKFKSMSHYEKWADSEAAGNHEVHDVRLHESTEEDEAAVDSSLDELSKFTLAKYAKKATLASDKHKRLASSSLKKWVDSHQTDDPKKKAGHEAKYDYHHDKELKRKAGARKAMFRDQTFVSEELQLEDYSLEEIQQFIESEDFATLDELSKKTLASYVKKASDSSAKHAFFGGSQSQEYADKPVSLRPDDYGSYRKKALKRLKGVSKAADKLAKD